MAPATTTQESTMTASLPAKITTVKANTTYGYCTVFSAAGGSPFERRYDVYVQYEGEEICFARQIPSESAANMINSLNSRVFWGEEL
jgi:hypothetical protein